jgi:hypothetical protein
MWKPLAGTGAVSEKSEITKVEAARRQLDCAIRLFFEDEDSLPIHTLAWAAFKVLFDLYPKHRSDGFSHHLERIISGFGWSTFSSVPNFLKHADNDADAVLHGHSAETVEGIIGGTCVLHHRLTGMMTPEMRAFDNWMHLMNPEEFKLEPDPDPEFEVEFRCSIAVLQASTSDTRLVLGKVLMEFYRANPNAGGYGAPTEP